MILNTLIFPYIISAILTFMNDNHNIDAETGISPKIPKNIITQNDSDFPTGNPTYNLFN